MPRRDPPVLPSVVSASSSANVACSAAATHGKQKRNGALPTIADIVRAKSTAMDLKRRIRSAVPSGSGTWVYRSGEWELVGGVAYEEALAEKKISARRVDLVVATDENGEHSRKPQAPSNYRRHVAQAIAQERSDVRDLELVDVIDEDGMVVQVQRRGDVCEHSRKQQPRTVQKYQVAPAYVEPGPGAASSDGYSGLATSNGLPVGEKEGRNLESNHNKFVVAHRVGKIREEELRVKDDVASGREDSAQYKAKPENSQQKNRRQTGVTAISYESERDVISYLVAVLKIYKV